MVTGPSPLCSARRAAPPGLPVSPEARGVAIFISRPNHLTADELVALDSGHHRLYNHPHSLRRRLAVRTRPVPLGLVHHGRNPPRSRAAPPRKRTRRRLNAGRLMWHAWGPPPGSLPVGLGPQLAKLTGSTTLMWQPLPLTCGPHVLKRIKINR